MSLSHLEILDEALRNLGYEDISKEVSTGYLYQKEVPEGFMRVHITQEGKQEVQDV